MNKYEHICEKVNGMGGSHNPFHPLVNPKEYRNYETAKQIAGITERHPKAVGTVGGIVAGHSIGLNGAKMYNKRRMEKLIKRKASRKEIESEKRAADKRERIATAAGMALGGAAGYGLGRAGESLMKKQEAQAK